MIKRGTATGEDLSTSGKQAGRGSTEEQAYRRRGILFARLSRMCRPVSSGSFTRRGAIKIVLTCGAIPYPTPISERLKSLPGPHSARTTIDRSPTVPLRFARQSPGRCPPEIWVEMSGEEGYNIAIRWQSKEIAARGRAYKAEAVNLASVSL